mmetsp:Transcript_11988/g.22176  ORF Transcript_11988/g.22176 Transcript_11988/m.22176 type:complete len:286 (+) Transcript_11988:1419-2276(+)
MIGFLATLITLINSGIPPLSLPPIPSTSSIITSLLLTAPVIDKARDITTSLTCSSMALLFRASEAFSSMTSYPIVVAISVARVVLPIPGGPEISAALAPGFSLLKATFCVFLMCTASHLLSQSTNFLMFSVPPITSSSLEGLYLSTHNNSESSMGGGGAGLSPELNPPVAGTFLDTGCEYDFPLELLLLLELLALLELLELLLVVPLELEADCVLARLAFSTAWPASLAVLIALTLAALIVEPVTVLLTPVDAVTVLVLDVSIANSSNDRAVFSLRIGISRSTAC